MGGRESGPDSAGSQAPAPASIRLSGDGRTPPLSVRGTRSEELAALYRKIADLQAELADAEARHEQVRAESASADEMVGQMLARVSEVEARLHRAQADLGEAQGRAETAEERAADLAAQLRAARLDVGQLRDDLDAVGQEANAYRGEIESLRAKLSREQEERETLRQRVIEFARVSEERDAALLREELIEAELGAVRSELAEAKLVADPHNPGTRAREARLTGAERLRAELAAAHESAVRVAEQLRLAVESVTGKPEETTAAAAGSPVRDAEDDEPTQIFGDLAKEIAPELD